VLHKPLGDDLSHDLISVVDSLPAVEPQREGDRIRKLFGIGGREVVRHRGGAYKADENVTRTKARAQVCNDYRLLTASATLFDGFSEIKIPIRFSEGNPNIEPREDIKITDTAPIVRAVDQAGALVQRRWSWPGRNGKPVYNFRSEGREFAAGRCLIPADGFYEFTDPADKRKKRKDKWLFTKAGEPWFCIAGIWRADKDVGEAFTMLTMPPGPDLAPYHDRQIVILDRADWAAWLDPSVPAQSLIRPLRVGELKVERAG
jgi:putative SOS response-associated peptidase YedK